jgi:periplasmic protein TonB
MRPGKDGVGYPSCVYCPDPKMSHEARAAQFSGTVVLQITVGADGRASDIKIVKRVGYGLDEEAVAAVQSWRFKPALGPGGTSVPPSVPVEIQFRSTIH